MYIFFSVKTSLFTTYLLGFVVFSPWRQECRQHARNRETNGYHRVETEDPIISDGAEESQLEDDAPAVPSTSNGGSGSILRSLSSPLFVPANIPESGKSSGTEESDGDGISVSSSSRRSVRRVRFKQLAEMVEMNPREAMAANLARLSYNASLRAQAAIRKAAQRLTLHEVAKLALYFLVPWFLGSYCYQKALAKTEAAVVNILSSSSSLFTLVLSAIFKSDSSDRITVSKGCAVFANICGVFVVSYNDLHIEGDSVPKGAIWAIFGSIFYSIYIVLLKRKVSSEENMDAPMFFGFVGLFNAVLLWPGLLFCHFTGTEVFELPTLQQVELLVTNGFIGTVLSELLWLWGCFYTSSLMGTLAIGLTIPLSIIADILWRNKHYETIFVIGVIPMFFSFFIIAMLTHYEDWDPLMDFFRVVWNRLRVFFCCRQEQNSYVFDRQERELLINQQQQQQPQQQPNSSLTTDMS